MGASTDLEGHWKPIIKITKGFTVEAGSIYGKAYYNNKWLGVRIVKIKTK